ncbi:MAG: methyltransferase domain-containing protein, partial [Chthoniobacterales bacterium]
MATNETGNNEADRPFSLAACPVCGGARFRQQTVLWPELIAEWQLAPEEVQYIDQQQGFACRDCGNNLRAMTLAAAITDAVDHPGPLRELCRSDARFRDLRLLEINAAGELTSVFSLMPHHSLVAFPEFDMQKMNLPDNSVEIIVHSDTLEHISDPLQALRECRRVLNQGGHLFYTVPVVVARLTRSRAGLPPSYHGTRAAGAVDDYRVQTEYGADFWCELFAAGFRNVSLTSLLFPAS